MEPVESKEFPGYYEIPNFENYVITRGIPSVIRKSDGYFMQYYTDSKGYQQTTYIPKNKKKNRRVSIHKLMALAFIGSPPVCEDEVVSINHINGIKTDNRPENLEWCSSSYNTKHAWGTGLCDGLKQIIHVRNEFSKVEVAYNSYSDCARALGTNLCRILDRLKSGPDKVWPGHLRFRNENDSFKHLSIEEIEKSLCSYSESRPVIVRWLDSSIEEEFLSVTEFSRKINCIQTEAFRLIDLPYQPVNWKRGSPPFQLQYKKHFLPWREIGDIYEELRLTRRIEAVFVLSSDWCSSIETYKSNTECSKVYGLNAATVHRRLKSKGERIYDGKRFIRELDYYRRSGRPDWMHVW